MRRWFVVLFLLVLGSGAFASSLVVYPFDSQDALLGVAVADRIAEAFQGQAEVIPPDLAPGLVPPLVAQGGFVNLVTLLGAKTMTEASGAPLLRGALGADVAVTGSVAIGDAGYRLSLQLDGPAGFEQRTLEAPKDAPGRLAVEAAPVIAAALGTGTPAVNGTIDLSGVYGDYVRALTLVASGLPQDAANLLSQAEQKGALPARAKRLLSDLQAVQNGGTGSDSATMAVVSLSLPQLDEARSVELFQKMETATGLPVAEVWIGALDSNVNDKQGATAAFDRAAAAYPFGQAARAAFRQNHGVAGATDDIDAVLAGWPGGHTGAAALLAASVAAQQAKATDLEKRALVALEHAAPYLTYSFERLSYIAFDQNDPLAAARALRVAVDLAPDNALYWTNLGWSYYLLGFMDRSVSASQKALALDPTQTVADYNLGLARVVTGDLTEGLAAYTAALRVDPKVDADAVHDLERARTRFPDQPGVEFALGRLYEADGRRADALAAYRAYLAATAAGAPLRAEAQQRVQTLSAPPPPMTVSGGVALTLGRHGADASPYHPKDPVYPSFELSTKGNALPRKVDVRYRLLGGDGSELASATETANVPQNAVGFVVDDLALDLPADLTPGSFVLEVTATADGGLKATASTTIAVVDGPVALRQLLGRGIVMTSLDTGATLYSAADLQHPDALPAILVQELRATANEAEQALPKATSGRFNGLSGSEVFQRSTQQDVQDFLDYLLASGASNTSFTFVDGYAQWVLDGTPAQPPAGAKGSGA
ncbi:MAG TPA: tetratricopeptide repeat protein [Trueperaceae bacterium]|nr:tetratricopeptide repeat protein [Trueperaceae bacterium]